MNITRKIEKYLGELPDHELAKSYYVEKIKKYSNECGCSHGAIFLTAAVILIVFYASFVESVNINIYSASIALAFIIFSSFLGKLIGIGIAKVKLILLYQSVKLKANLKPKQV